MRHHFIIMIFCLYCCLFSSPLLPPNSIESSNFTHWHFNLIDWIKKSVVALAWTGNSTREKCCDIFLLHIWFDRWGAIIGFNIVWLESIIKSFNFNWTDEINQNAQTCQKMLEHARTRAATFCVSSIGLPLENWNEYSVFYIEFIGLCQIAAQHNKIQQYKFRN